MLRASRFAPEPNASNDRFGDIDATSGLEGCAFII